MFLEKAVDDPTEKRTSLSWHRVVELTGIKPVQNGSTCWTGAQNRVRSIWGLGPCLASQVPYLAEAPVVVEDLKKTYLSLVDFKHWLDFSAGVHRRFDRGRAELSGVSLPGLHRGRDQDRQHDAPHRGRRPLLHRVTTTVMQWPWSWA